MFISFLFIHVYIYINILESQLRDFRSRGLGILANLGKWRDAPPSKNLIKRGREPHSLPKSLKKYRKYPKIPKIPRAQIVSRCFVRLANSDGWRIKEGRKLKEQISEVAEAEKQDMFKWVTTCPECIGFGIWNKRWKALGASFPTLFSEFKSDIFWESCDPVKMSYFFA